MTRDQLNESAGVPAGVGRWWPAGVVLLVAVASLRAPSALLVNLGRLSYTRAALQKSDLAAPEYLQALSSARHAISLDPHNSRAYLLAGLSELARGRDDVAISQLGRVADLDVTDVLAKSKLAEAYYRRGEEQLAVQYWRAARATPDFLMRGADASTRGDWAEALECFTIAAKVDPGEYEAWLGLGYSYTGLGKLQDARNSYEEAIRRHPVKSVAYVRLAELYDARLKQPDLAGAVVADGLATVRPASADLYYLSSRLAAARGEYAAAEQDAGRAISLDRSNGAYLLWLGDVYVLQKSIAQAVTQYTQTAGQTRDPRWVWVSQARIGHVYAAQNDWTAAVAAYQAAVATSVAQKAAPTAVAQNYVTLGDALLKVARIDLARSAFQEALNHDPANPIAARRLTALGPQ